MKLPLLRIPPLLAAAVVFIVAIMPVALAVVRLHEVVRERDLQRFETEVTKPMTNIRFMNLRVREFLEKVGDDLKATGVTPGALRANARVGDTRQRDRHILALATFNLNGDKPTLMEWSGRGDFERPARTMVMDLSIQRALAAVRDGSVFASTFTTETSPSNFPRLLFYVMPLPADTFIAMIVDWDGLVRDSITLPLHIIPGRLPSSSERSQNLANKASQLHPETQASALQRAVQPEAFPSSSAAFVRHSEVDVLGQSAQLIFEPKPEFWLDSQRRLPWVIGISGGMVALLLASFMGTLAGQRHRLERRVEERTQALRDANEKLTQAVLQEQELNAVKTSFISMVSHELHTPMQLIQSSADLLRRYHDRISEEQRASHFENIGEAVTRVSELTEGVLLFSRLESGRVELNSQPIDLCTWCEGLIEELSAFARNAGRVELVCQVAEPAHADERILRHVLTNILSNALKYSPDERAVQFTVERDGDAAVFRIQDHGVGIPEEDQARLFSTFHRGSNVHHIPGNGLGLVIVKRCVDLCGGTLGVDSKPHEGTTVTIRLPFFKPAE